jgi:hypothetical protein
MKDIDATIFGINEVNQDTQHPYIRQLLHTHQRRVWDNSKLQYASSNLDIRTIRKPGGTLLGVTGSISGRVIDNFSDDMGRWCGISLLRKLAKRYTIICAYQVPLVTGRSGPSTSHTNNCSCEKRPPRKPTPTGPFLQRSTILTSRQNQRWSRHHPHGRLQ